MNDDQIHKVLFKSADWSAFEDKLKSKKDRYLGSWQYWERDKDGDKFYINAHVTDMSQFPEVPQEKCVTFDTQFNKGKKTFNIKLLSSDIETLSGAIEFFNNVWENLNCDYYKRYKE